MKKIKNYPVLLTLVLLVFQGVVGHIAVNISYQVLTHIPGMTEWEAVNYLNMFITEILPFIAMVLVFKRLIISLDENRESLISNEKSKLLFWQMGKLKYLLFLPIFIQISWDISTLFTEEICISLFSLSGITILFFCLIGTLSIGLLEETLWRKIIFQSMWQKWGIIQGIIVSSILFGAIHYVNMYTQKADFYETTIQVVSAVGMGLLLAALYYVTRSFLLVVMIHGLCNFSNFFCNELVGWSFSDYWWNDLYRAIFVIFYYITAIFLMVKIQKSAGC